MGGLLDNTAIQWMTFLTAVFGFVLLVLGMTLAVLEHRRAQVDVKDVKSALHLDNSDPPPAPDGSELSDLERGASAARERLTNALAGQKMAHDDQAKAAAEQEVREARAAEQHAVSALRAARHLDSAAAGDGATIRPQGAVESGIDAVKTFVEVLPKLTGSAQLVLAGLLLIGIASALAGVQYAIPHAQP